MNARLPTGNQYNDNMLKDLFNDHLVAPLRNKVLPMKPPPATSAMALTYVHQDERSDPELMPSPADYEHLRALTMNSILRTASLYNATSSSSSNLDTPITTNSIHMPLVRASSAFSTPLDIPSVPAHFTVMPTEKPLTML